MRGITKRFLNHKGEKYECHSRTPIKEKTIGYVDLWRHATLVERAATCASILLALLASCGLVAAITIYGEITSLFVERSLANGTTLHANILNVFGGGTLVSSGGRESYMEALVEDSAAFGWASAAIIALQLLAAAFAVTLANWAARRQINRVRYKLLEAALRQDMAWFDTDVTLNFATNVTEEAEKLREAIGEQVVMFFYLAGSVLCGGGLALAYGWRLALAGFAVVPLSVAVSAVVSKYQTRYSREELKAYGRAGRIAEEVLGGIRTVVAFGGEDEEAERYAAKLIPAERVARRRGLVAGVGAGLGWLFTYSINSVVFAYGTQLIVNDADLPPEHKCYHPGVMVTILFCIFVAAQNVALCNPHLETFAMGRGAANSLWRLLERESKIDSLRSEGVAPDTFHGEISLENVYFNYPSRPDVKVLRGFSLRVRAGETVALVGPSGCGKSTVLQLLQRLYEPESGHVTVDGHRLETLDLHNYRTSIGVVGQEPILFAGTIKENIALGRPGATFEQIVGAAKRAFAHDFIVKLAQGYETVIGERGAQLSGGQKQRIAIARSLIREPPILLLDEATSALDSQSERRVQAALDAASVGRTTLVVSHRLSTIVNATRIVYMEQGAVLEQGSHDELLEKKGLYWKLVQTDLENRRAPVAISEIDEDGSDELPISKSTLSRSISVYSTNDGGGGGIRRSMRAGSSCRMSPAAVASATAEINLYAHQDEKETVTLEDEADPEAESEDGPSFWRLLALNGREWPQLLAGGIASIAVGGTMPLFAYLFSQVYGMFENSSMAEILSQSRMYAGVFAGVAAGCGIAVFFQTYLFSLAGNKLTTRLRVETFRAYLHQEVGWFDSSRNPVGALCARLSGDAASVQGATGLRLGTVLQGISTMLLGIILAALYSWKMTLVSLLSVPVVMGGIYLEGYLMKECQKKERRATENAAKIATEAILNVRTVHSLGIEREILSKYASAIEEAGAAAGVRAHLRGPVYGLCLCAPTLGYAVSLAYGGYLVAREDMPYKYAILVSEALIYGAWMLGQTLSFAPNFSAARRSGARVLRLLQRTPRVLSPEKAVDNPLYVARGLVEYEGVSFRYPTRPKVPVLNGFDLRLEAGKTVALVGASGCGKSTCIQLLLRFYDADEGSLKLDGDCVRTELPLGQLRHQLGLVQQEPVLFDRTIAENIAYGDNARSPTMDRVIAAAKAANIHTFIMTLPSGYETRLGSGGAQLSGGQKQRIAIARALLREPRVLLLDEATSALDAQSERAVQEALEVASKGRTTLVIAHRLATVRNADTICLIHKGKIVEKGTHEELMNLGGLYCELQVQQQ